MKNNMREFLLLVCGLSFLLAGCERKETRLLNEFEQSINDYVAASGVEAIEQAGINAQDKAAGIDSTVNTLSANEQSRYAELNDRFSAARYGKELELGFIGEYRIVTDLSDTSINYTKGAAVLTVPNVPRPFSENIRMSIDFFGIDFLVNTIGLDTSTAEGKAFRNMFRNFYNQKSNNVSSFALVDGQFNACMMVVPSNLNIPSSARKQYLVYFQKQADRVVPDRIDEIVSYETLETTDTILFDFLKPVFDSIENSINDGTTKETNYLY
jgi:hypothetical protein